MRLILENPKMNLKKILLFVFIFFAIPNCIAQNNVITIHPSVGDTIDRTEKIKYMLFEKIENDIYLFSVISRYKQDTTIIHFKRSDTVKLKITDGEIISIIYNIDRLNVYYNSGEATSSPYFIKNHAYTPSGNNKKIVNEKNLKLNFSEKKLMKLDYNQSEKTRPKEWDKTRLIGNGALISPPMPLPPAPTFNIPVYQPPTFPH